MNSSEKKRYAVKSGRMSITPLTPSEYDLAFENVNVEKELPLSMTRGLEEVEIEARKAYKKACIDTMNLFFERREIATSKFNENDRNFYWYTLWEISYNFKQTGVETIGYMFFNGEAERGRVGISILITDRYKNNDYATDTLKTMSSWAFNHKDVYIVNASIPAGNDVAIKAFGKAGFIFREKSDGIEIYSKESEKSVWGGLYLIIGVWEGLAFGIIFNSFIIGMIIGVLLGFVTGFILDANSKKRRLAVIGTEEDHHRKKDKK